MTPTQKQAAAELARRHQASLAAPDPCAESPLRWLEIAKPKIRAKIDGAVRIVEFDPYDYQQEVLEAWNEPRRVILKARQLGLSTVFGLECYWVARYRPGSVILVISIKEKLGVQFLNEVKFQVEQAGDKVTKCTETEIVFANGSIITVEGASQNPGRGVPATRIYLDEAAFMLYDEAMWASLLPAAERGGRVTLISTPHGDSNVFARVWNGLMGTWKRFRYDWRRLPRPEGWEAETRAQLSKQRFAQEHDCDLTASVDRRFDGADISVCYDPSTRSEPVEGRFYRIATDPAGKGKDYFVIQVWDRTEAPYKLVFEARWQVALYSVYYDEIGRLARLYRPDAVHMDGSTIGDVMAEEIQKRLLGVCKLEKIVFTKQSKPTLMEAITLLVQQHKLRFFSDDLREEMLVFTDEDEKKLTTDCLMSAAIFARSVHKPARHWSYA